MTFDSLCQGTPATLRVKAIVSELPVFLGMQVKVSAGPQGGRQGACEGSVGLERASSTPGGLSPCLPGSQGIHLNAGPLGSAGSCNP